MMLRWLRALYWQLVRRPEERRLPPGCQWTRHDKPRGQAARRRLTQRARAEALRSR